MVNTFKSKVPFPFEIMEVSSETVCILEEQNYFDEQFDNPDQARTLFYESIAHSLVKKFIDGDELIWGQQEFEIMLAKLCVEQALNELESNNVIDIFENEDGEKIVVLKSIYL